MDRFQLLSAITWREKAVALIFLVLVMLLPLILFGGTPKLWVIWWLVFAVTGGLLLWSLRRPKGHGL
jgi:hypothetical protein